MSEIKQGMEYWVTVEADRDRLLAENRALRSALEQLVDHATHDGALGNGEVAVVAARAALNGLSIWGSSTNNSQNSGVNKMEAYNVKIGGRMTASRGATPETDGYFAVIAPAEWLKHPQREVDGAKEFARRLERQRDEAVALLRETQRVLCDHWFTDSDGESYNNEDVIKADGRIKAFLATLDGGKHV